MISAGQRQTSLDYLAIGADEGAKVVSGGEVLDRRRLLPLARRASPTSTTRMRIAREEIFGPVASVIPFDDEDDAIRIANDSDYGLSGLAVDRQRHPRHPRRQGAAHRHALGQHQPQRALRDAVRRLQALRPRPRARHGRHGPLHRGQERLLLRGVTSPRRTGTFLDAQVRSPDPIVHNPRVLETT